MPSGFFPQHIIEIKSQESVADRKDYLGRGKHLLRESQEAGCF